MNVIKIYLKTSGSIADLYKDFNLYTGSYQNVLLTLYVPKTLLYENQENTFSNAVKTGAILTASNGVKITTKAYYADYVKDEEVDGVSYSVYSQLLPKEYVIYSGTQTIVINVLSLDNTDSEKPVILQITTSQTALLTVQQSAYLSDEDVLLPSEAELLNARIDHILDGSTIPEKANQAKYYTLSTGESSGETIEEAIVRISTGGISVVANPDETGTETLARLKVGETIYNIPDNSEALKDYETKADAEAKYDYLLDTLTWKIIK